MRFGVVDGEIACGASVCACAAAREGEQGTGACMTRVEVTWEGCSGGSRVALLWSAVGWTEGRRRWCDCGCWRVAMLGGVAGQHKLLDGQLGSAACCSFIAQQCL